MSVLKLFLEAPDVRHQPLRNIKILVVLLGIGLSVVGGKLISTTLAHLVADGQLLLFLIFTMGFAFIGQLIAQGGQEDDSQFQVRLFLTAFVSRALLTLMLYQVFILMFGHPFANVGGDDIAYHVRAHSLVADWKASGLYFPTYHAGGYDSLVALFYLLFGPVPLVVRSLNCFAGALCAVYAYRIGGRLLGSRVGRTAALLVAFVPDLLFWSAIGYRDILLAALILYIVDRLIDLVSGFSGTLGNLSPLGAAFLAYSILDLRGAITLLTAGLLYYLIYTKASDAERVFFFRRMALGLLMVGVFLGLFGFANGLRGEPLNAADILAQGESKRQRLAAASTSESLSNVFWRDLSGWKGAFSDFGRFIYPLLQPFPSFFPPPKLNFSLLWAGAIIWYVMLPCVVYGLVFCLKNHSRDTFLLYGIPLLFLVGIFVVYYANSYRYRIRFMPLLWILTALGIVKLRDWHRWYTLTLIVVGIMYMTYIALKWGII